MIELLKHYIGRSLPEPDETSPQFEEEKLRAFQTNPNLRQKVQGKTLLPFFGNTTVFLLEDDTRQQLSALQEELYQKAGWMLADKLKEETFHMTLHDLVNGPELTADLQRQMQEAEQKAKALLAGWRDQSPLQMEATWMFNMVNTSIVLGLAPVDDDSRKRLDAMYTALHEVVPLNHGLTPHITMAYYRPDTYTAYDLKCLKKALRPVKLNITLQMKDLVFQNFTDMNSYQTIF